MTNNRVTNADIYGVLMELKEDMGAVKTSSAIQLEGLKSHALRLTALEGQSERQRGALTVWGAVATGAATIAAMIVQWFRH